MTSSTSQASSTSQPSAPEGMGRSGPESTYRYGRFYRSPVFAQLAAAAPLAATALWMAFSGAGPLEWLSAAGFLTVALLGGYQSAGTLLSVFHLTEDRLRQERPLHADKDIPLGEVRRMFIGGHSVELYASPGPEPDLEFERGLEGGDELIEKLARRLPAGAKIEHPSGELAERLSKVAASVSGQRPDGAGITDPVDTLGVHRSDNEGAAENRSRFSAPLPK